MVAKQQGDSPIVIKKYANRRLYNTSTSSYVTLEHLCEMVKKSEDFVVYDAKSGDDITRSVLTQIIVEEESKGGQTLLPIAFLRQLISYYGDGVQQTILPNYLEMSMNSFTENQEKMKSYMSENMTSVFPFGNIEEMGRNNMVMFENAMKMFNPFAGVQPENTKEEPAEKEAASTQENPAKAAENVLTDLQKQLNEMQKKIAEMDKK